MVGGGVGARRTGMIPVGLKQGHGETIAPAVFQEEK